MGKIAPLYIFDSGMRFVYSAAHHNHVNCLPQTFTLRDLNIFITYLQVFYPHVVTLQVVFQLSLSCTY